MHIYSKIAVAALATALISIPGFAQAPQQNPNPSQEPDGAGPRGPMSWQMRTGGPQGQRGWGVRGRGWGPRGFGLGRLLNDPDVRQQLGITDAQAAKIRQQESDFRKAEVRNRADLQVKRMDLNDLLSADKPDRSAIDKKLQEVGAAQLALEKSAIDFRLTMREALTPEQRQKLQQIMRQRRQPMPRGNAGPRGMQGGRRGGPGAAPPPNTPRQAPPSQ